MSVRLQRALGKEREPGQYSKAVDAARAHGLSAIVRCPGCGKDSTLGKLHQVDAAGTVTPSYVCPHPPCSFHDWVTLESWSDAA